MAWLTRHERTRTVEDGAIHGHVGRSVSGAVAFLLPVATAVYVVRRNRKWSK